MQNGTPIKLDAHAACQPANARAVSACQSSMQESARVEEEERQRQEVPQTGWSGSRADSGQTARRQCGGSFQ